VISVVIHVRTEGHLERKREIKRWGGCDSSTAWHCTVTGFEKLQEEMEIASHEGRR